MPAAATTPSRAPRADDTLGGGQGNDTIDGRGGFDLVDYGTSYSGAPTAGAIVNLSSAGGDGRAPPSYAAGTARDGWGGIDTLSNIEGAIGTAFGDTLIGRSSAASRLEGGAGDDSLVGGNGANTLMGGDGNDTITFGGYTESLLGGADIDALIYRGARSLVIDLGTEATLARRISGFHLRLRRPHRRSTGSSGPMPAPATTRSRAPTATTR